MDEAEHNRKFQSKMKANPGTRGNVHYESHSSCLHSEPAIKPISNYFESPHADQVQVIHSLLSAAECQGLIQRLEAHGLTAPPGFQPADRDCTRRHTVDPEMSHQVMSRLRPYLPEIVRVDGVRWKLSRFTHHWRYVRYFPGGHFAPHWDGAKMLPWHEMSMFTVQIYLNEDFEGGHTRFYLDHQAQRGPSRDISFGEIPPVLIHGEEPNLWIRPQTGSALVFNHGGDSVLHDGEPVRQGIKYIMRADVLYQAISEDIPLLQNPSTPCLTWCGHTAQRRGTRNFIGQVWVCWCSVDDAGAMVPSHHCEPAQPQQTDLPWSHEDTLSRLHHGHHVILLSGKRASGKDYMAMRLVEYLSSLGLGASRHALGDVNKKAFATQHQLDLDRLMTDRQHKESHRIAMVAHHAARSAEDPAWCIRELMDTFLQSSDSILVVSDWRMEEDVAQFAAYPVNITKVRVHASDAARLARGWDADPTKDALPTETDLDGYLSWDACFDNSSEHNHTLLDRWTEDTLLPRIQ